MKLIKQANGKQIIKMNYSEWEKIGKEAGWWDNVKQVGKGLWQGAKGVGNVAAGGAHLLNSIVSSLESGISKLRQIMDNNRDTGETKSLLGSLKKQMDVYEQELNGNLQDAENVFYGRKAQTNVKLVKNASGKFSLKITRNDWVKIGVNNGWIE